jgi:hypothetical protein
VVGQGLFPQGTLHTVWLLSWSGAACVAHGLTASAWLPELRRVCWTRPANWCWPNIGGGAAWGWGRGCSHWKHWAPHTGVAALYLCDALFSAYSTHGWVLLSIWKSWTECVTAHR